MVNKNKNKNIKKRNTGASDNSFHSAPNPIAYVHPRTKIEKFRVSTTDVINSSGGGNIFFSFPIDPTTTSGEWSAVAALYEEFRIIGGLWTIVPSEALVVSGSSRAQGLAILAYDTALFYTPTGYVDLTAYATRDIINTQSIVHKPYSYGFTVPMAGKDNPISWFGTAATFTPTSCLLMVAEGLTPSLQYFQFVVDFYVEFRTRS